VNTLPGVVDAREQLDCLIVVGTSATVYPTAGLIELIGTASQLLPQVLPAHAPS
jgi:NAD-dependent SIR2 family protein deacetylase